MHFRQCRDIKFQNFPLAPTMMASHEDSVVSEQCVWSLTKLLLWPLDKLSFTSNVQDFIHQFLKIKDQLYKI